MTVKWYTHRVDGASAQQRPRRVDLLFAANGVETDSPGRVAPMAGVMIARKLFPPEPRRATLDFTYTDDELERIRSGEMLDQQANWLSRKATRLTKQAFKRLGILAVPYFAIFGLVAASPGARENNNSLAVIVLAVGFFALMIAMNQALIWWRYRKKANDRRLRIITAPAIVSSGHKVTFGVGPGAPHWIFPYRDFDEITPNALHNVYYCSDVLGYLEEVDEDLA